MRLFDAHNHLQDDRFAGQQETLVDTAKRAGVQRMVVNGACESDWQAVLALAQKSDIVIPSLGFHPWYLHECSPGWLDRLDSLLGGNAAAVGEIGLDRWILKQPASFLSTYSPAFGDREPASIDLQAAAFVAQLELAARHGVPASIHCLHAWGLLEEILRKHQRPATLILHSYGGPAEMVPGLARMGAYFSFPGYFLHDRKARQREAFKSVPIDRLLVETDAPDQVPPARWISHPLHDPATGKVLNHPANLESIYTGLAGYLELPEEELAARIESNFHAAFGDH